MLNQNSPLLFILLLLGPFVPCRLAAQEYSDQVKQWPEVTLKFTEEMPMKDLFDSGLQPYRWPRESGNRKVGIRHLRLAVQTRRRLVTPAFPMERAEFSIIAPAPAPLIYDAEFFSPPLTVNEARVEMTKWLPFARNGDSMATEENLEKFLAAVKADWLHYAYVNGVYKIKFGFRIQTNDEIAYWISFMQAFDWDAPVRLHFGIDINSLPTRKHWEWPEGLLQPPPGYEHLSMETPSEWGPDAKYVPVTNEARSPLGSLPPGVKLPESFPDWDAIRKGTAYKGADGPRSAPEGMQSSTRWLIVFLLMLTAATVLRLVWKKHS